MKKLFALLLLPSLAFAGKIGENYVGANAGHFTIASDIRTSPNIGAVDAEFDGWGFSIDGNINLSSPTNKQWGTDVLFGYMSADLEPNAAAINILTDIYALLGDTTSNPKADLETSQFYGSVRPFLKFGDGVLFASVGFNRIEINDSKETGLVFEAGYEATFDKITLTPNISHISLDEDFSDRFNIGIDVNYELSREFDFVFSYVHTEADGYALTTGGLTITEDPSSDLLSFGITYNF